MLINKKGSSLDAVVAGCSECEQQQCDGTVGYGGDPDEEGEVTLDAMIMDGNSMRVGAVGCIRDIKNAISVARAVMDHTMQTLLVGELATRFAVEMGFKQENLSTNRSNSLWKTWKSKQCQPNFRQNVSPDPNKNCGPYKPAKFSNTLNQNRPRSNFKIGKKNHDTIGMVVIDSQGHIAAGTTTNGVNHKVPGRVGDSPIAGAGSYADSEVGGAAATGDGDVMMRFLPSFYAVILMKQGMDPDTAAEKAIEPIKKYYPSYSGAVIAVNKKGQFGAACHGMAVFQYSAVNTTSHVKVHMKECSNSPQTRPNI